MAHPPGHSHPHGHPHPHGHTHEDVLFDADQVPLHVRGRLVENGEPCEFWIDHGIIHDQPVDDARTLCDDGWVMPGLVDSHSHVGLDASGAVDRATTEQQALDEREAGVLLIRDAGSPADTRWIDERPDLPQIIRAGRHIARPKRYLRNYADEVEPDDLVGSVERQVAAGDGWVKLVGDWIDRSTGDLAPLWEPAIARAAIDRAHDLGARVTAHCFGEQSVAELVAAGIDGIEHGTGLSDEVIEQMAARQVALVPTMINLDNFPAIADSAQAKFPVYAAHMRDLYARRHRVLRSAVEAGVPVYAGTDAGGVMPHGLIGAEIEQLATISSPHQALGAASWRARRWLGRPGLEAGAAADLVIFDADPRSEVAITRHPRIVVLNGRVVRGAVAG